jgi:hypothetical protein
MVQFDEIVAAQQGLNRDAIATKAQSLVPTTPQESPATAPVSMDKLGTAQAINLPQPNTDLTDASGIVAGANQATKGIDAYLKEMTPPETETSKQYTDLLGSINELLPQTQNKQQAQLDTEKQMGVPQLKKQLASLNSQILSRVAEYEKAYQLEETRTAPISNIVGRQAALRRVQASEIGLMQARALGLQGQVEMAQATADRAIDLKYGTLEDTINVKMQQLQLIQPILDKEERTFAAALERKYTEEREKLAEEKEKAKQNIALAMEAGLQTKFVNRNGEFFRTSDGKPFSTPEEFFKAAGVSSFEEAYQRGLIGDYNPDMAVNRSIIADMISKYPDAGITLQDTPESARAKLGQSRIYGEQVRPPMGPGGGSSVTIPGIGTLTNTQIDNISPLVTAFRSEPIVQNYNTIAEGYEFANSISSTSKNAADHQALIYAFAKAMDPGSVVREGEYNTVQKYSQSLVKSYGKSVEQAINGTGFLSEQAINGIKQTIASRYNTAARNYGNIYNETSRRVELVGGLPQGAGTQFLNNYSGGYTVAPRQTTVGPVNPGAQPTQQMEQAPAQTFMQKTFNFLFGD